MLSSHWSKFYIGLLFGMLTNVGMQHQVSACGLVHEMLSSHRIEFYICLLFGMLTHVGMQPPLSRCNLVVGKLFSHSGEFYTCPQFGMLTIHGMALSSLLLVPRLRQEHVILLYSVYQKLKLACKYQQLIF